MRAGFVWGWGYVSDDSWLEAASWRGRESPGKENELRGLLSTSTREARGSRGRRRDARRLKVRERRQEHRRDAFTSPSRSNTRYRGRDARDTPRWRLPRFRGAFDVGSTNSSGARGVARVPSGCSCLNVERADIFVVDRREGERWFPTGVLLCARSFDPCVSWRGRRIPGKSRITLARKLKIPRQIESANRKARTPNGRKTSLRCSSMSSG
jgi:hypothetical protein